MATGAGWIALVLALCPSGPSVAAPPGGVPRLSGRILFQSRVEGRWQLFVLDPATAVRTRLGRSNGDDQYASFSPDGRSIAFESTRDGKPGIWVADDDGSDARRLAESGGECHDPTWGHDNTYVAYDCKRKDGHEIYRLDLAANRETRLTRSIWRSVLPHWSPDGRRVAFTRNQLGWDVYRMNADGSDIVVLSPDGGNCRPDWSPDGRRIAFVSDRADGKGDVWVMNADGANPVRLTRSGDTYDYDPSWSPDGAWIVYQSARDKAGPWRLEAMPAAGGTPVVLSPAGVDDRFPDWGR